jgi:cytochrome c2
MHPYRGCINRDACAGVVERTPQWRSGTWQGADLTWDEITLDRWLTNPSALVPGTKMFFRLDDAQARADVIAYLKELR